MAGDKTSAPQPQSFLLASDYHRLFFSDESVAVVGLQTAAVRSQTHQTAAGCSEAALRL